MDWKKEIKLSDLLPSRAKSDPAEAWGDVEDTEQQEKPKRKLSLGRGPKQEKQSKPAKQAKQPKRKPAPMKKDGRARHKRLVGLKIGGSQLAAAQVTNNGLPELVRVARESLDHGIIMGGELREPDALASALKRFFRAHKLPKSGVRLGIASNRIGVRVFEISGIDDPKQLDNAIRFRAQETLPIPLEEAVLDYHLLGEHVDAEGTRVQRVLLVVAYRDLVERYVAACKKAGLKLAGVDLEAFALLRSLGDRPADGANAAVIVVSIGHDRSTLAVSNGSTCEFTRVIEWGGSKLDVAIARALNKTPSEVVALKRSLSLLDDGPIADVSEERAVAVRSALQHELQTLARELISSLQFYQGQPGSLGIGEIVITGGTSELPGIDAELARLIGVTVRIGDPLSRVKRGKKLGDHAQLGPFAVAIGLGIE
jgi:type IV pilus assembly protein PilM